MRLGDFLCVLLLFQAGVAGAIEDRRAEANRGTVGLIIDGGASSDAALATDLMQLLNDGPDVRVLPVLGAGSVQSIEDLLFLRGIDVAMVHVDVLDFLLQDGQIDDVRGRIRYVAKIAANQVHVLARKSVRTVADLEGRAVNFGSPGSGGFLTAGFVFDQLGIDVDVTAFDTAGAIAELQDGTIDAVVLVEAAPIDGLRALRDSGDLHFVELPRQLWSSGTYQLARLDAEHYPELIPAGAQVETASVAEVLVAYNWPADHPRGLNVARFAEGLVQNFQRLTSPPFHPSWRDVDLVEPLEGWPRLDLVDDLLAGLD